ncbi:MAG: FtsW/RodA/SpoVE family cell cycle protein [Brevundimonas sp.]|nr:MAG: FtsW/RodA/SpoVE family cell cycle protein [Brevundimonas sp.]
MTQRVWEGLAWLVIVAGVGLFAQMVAGAPKPVLIVQALATVVAALVLVGAARAPSMRSGLVLAGLVSCGLALAVLTVGPDMEGVRRWLRLGPVLVQPAALVLPAVAWAWASERATLIGAAPVAGFAILLAFQPDAGSATGLLSALVAVAVVRRGGSRIEMAALAVCLAATAVAWIRPDPLPAVDYVERVVVVALAALPVAGVLAALGLAAVVAPFIRRLWSGVHGRAGQMALAGLFGGLVLAGVLGNFPAPAVGSGASLLIGWGLALGLSARAT